MRIKTILITASMVCIPHASAYAQQSPAADDAKTIIQKSIMMQATWRDIHTPHAATFETLLRKEEKAPDGSTRQYYEFQVKGLPAKAGYILEQWPMGILKFSTLAEQVGISETGVLLCEDAKKLCGEGTTVGGPIGIWLQSSQGEPQRFILSTDDDKVNITATVVPFPAKGQDQSCTLELLRLFPQGQFFFTYGRGFQPGKDLTLTVESGGKKTKEHVKVTNDGLILNAEMPNTSSSKDSGELRATITDGTCHPSAVISYGPNSDRKL